MEAYDSKHGSNEGIATFDESLSHLYFDSLVHHQDSLELLIRLVGPERVLFGTEVPGSGSPVNPDTGRSYDDLLPLIQSIAWLEDAERDCILSGNARALYSRL